MERTTEIKTIVFDIGNVLVDFRWEDYLKGCGYTEEVIHKVGRATALNILWKKWDRGDVEEEELLRQCCIQEPEVENEIRKFFRDLLQIVKEFDYSADLIKRLKANGYHVYLLSNYGRSHYNLDKKYFKFLEFVDGGVISYEINRIKPEPEIYEALIHKYQINPTEAVFLDDLAENLEAARPFGFHTIQVKSYEQMIQDLHELGVRV